MSSTGAHRKRTYRGDFPRRASSRSKYCAVRTTWRSAGGIVSAWRRRGLTQGETRSRVAGPGGRGQPMAHDKESRAECANNFFLQKSCCSVRIFSVAGEARGRATLLRSRRCVCSRPKPSRWETIGRRWTTAHWGVYFPACAYRRLRRSVALPNLQFMNCILAESSSAEPRARCTHAGGTYRLCSRRSSSSNWSSTRL